MKVYCGECKHKRYHPHMGFIDIEMCYAKTYSEDTAIEPVKKVKSCDTVNKNNDCDCFEPCGGVVGFINKLNNLV